jgi:hypothetical protein
MTKPIKAYAPKFQENIMPDWVDSSMNGAKANVGFAFNKTWRSGWKQAEKFGYTIVPVEIREIEK